ncbi:MAG: glycosyltransferase family 2 protein, partial [bacterium]|nr:glycosyltransferase family 2 protein [bacterium]
AIKKNKYRYIVQLDGDGQHNYRDIPALLKPLIENKADLIVGSRFLAGENSYRIPFVRKIGMGFFRGLVRLFTRKRIKDVTSGFQAFNRKILKQYVADEFPSYYPDANVLILLIRNGFKIAEVPSAMFENQEGKSMHNRIGQQVYYVITMILSILVVVFKNFGKKNAH